MSDQEPIRLILTPEQRTLVYRASGHEVDAIELKREDAQPHTMMRFAWRPSAATGIPRQPWMLADDDDASCKPESD